MSDIEVKKIFLGLPTTCISDVLGGLTNLDYAIKPIDPQHRIVGRAFTVSIPAGDNLTVLQGIREAQPGDVLVIAAQGDTRRAVAGDFVAGLAQTFGLQGMVVDGVIRDIEGIRNLNFPVFSRGTTTASSNKYGGGHTNIPVSAGGTNIRPGDWIIGDIDGVVTVPSEQVYEVAKAARKKLIQDEERSSGIQRDKILAGIYIDNLLGTIPQSN
ncbi:RraA family protein [Paenibacillus barcinonensis]|uniref:RraA family protein n=1 Tax=Paenibacillus barcinonensis TaxID=198119 RepID=UPI001C0F482C|nr:RraA family protein [Paenibacillus barcinonensis]MBU5353412.1 RraA family protein [Paenibacillus barcinonensis]